MNNNQLYITSQYEPITSLEHFPCLSEINNKKRTTPRVSEIIGSSRFNIDDFTNDRIQKREKIHICKSIKEGGECSYGNRCNSAHFIDELVVKECGFKDRCNKIKVFKDSIKNIDPKNPCCFIHPGEDKEMLITRLGFDKNIMERPTKSVEDSYCTKLCNSFFSGTECPNKDICKYAHGLRELKVPICHFKDKCYLIVKNEGGKYIKAEGSKKICFFMHTDETMENYEERVIKNIRKQEFKKELKPKDNMRNRFDKGTENFWDSKIKSPVRSESPKENPEDKIVLNVPVDMAIDMLDSLLKSGNKNVQLNTY